MKIVERSSTPLKPGPLGTERLSSQMWQLQGCGMRKRQNAAIAACPVALEGDGQRSDTERYSVERVMREDEQSSSAGAAEDDVDGTFGHVDSPDLLAR